MNKILIEDIKRNLDLMGLGDELILEAPRTGPIDGLLNYLQGSSVRTVPELMKEVENGLTREGASQISSVYEKSIQYLAKKKVLASEERTFLSQIMRRFFPDLVETNVRSFVNFMKGPNGVGASFWPKLEEKLKDPAIDNSVIYNTLKPYLPNLNMEAVQLLRDELRKSSTSLQVPTTIPARVFTAEEQAVIKASREWEGLQAWDTDALEKLRKRNTAWYNFYLRFVDTILDSMRSRLKIVEETQQLIKTYETVPGAQSEILLNQIGENLLTLAQRNKEDFILMKNWIAQNVPSTSNIYTNHFKKAIITNDYYKLAESLLTGSARSEWEKMKGDFNKRRRGVRSAFLKLLFMGVAAPIRLVNKSFRDAYPKMLEKWFPNANMSRLKTDLLSGKTLTWAEINQYRKIFGLGETIFLLGKEFAIALLIAQSLKSFGMAAYDGLFGAYAGWDKKSQERYQRISNIPGVKRWVDKNVPDYWIMQDVAEVMGLIANYGVENLKRVEAYFPGLADDAVGAITRLANKTTVRTPEQVLETNELNRDMGDSLRIYQQRLDSITANLDSTRNTPQNTPIPGTKEKAKAYVIDPRGRVQMKEPLTFLPDTDGSLTYVVTDSTGFKVRVVMNEDGQNVKTWELVEQGN